MIFARMSALAASLATRPARLRPLLLGALAVLALQGGAPAASAALMTFDDLPFLKIDGPQTYAEDGLVATARDGMLGTFVTEGSLHMDDSGTEYPASMSFALERGRRFDPSGIDVLPISNFFVPDLDSPIEEVCDGAFCRPYDNLLLEGFRDGEPIAAEALYMGSEDRRLEFAPAFSALTELRVTARRPEPLGLEGECPDAPCAHFDLDNLEVAPIPLPAAAWFLLTGLAALAGVRTAGRWAGR